MVRLHLPDIAEHLEVLKLSPDMYLLDWVMTLYGRAAPLDLACRYDNIFYFFNITYRFFDTYILSFVFILHALSLTVRFQWLEYREILDAY